SLPLKPCPRRADWSASRVPHRSMYVTPTSRRRLLAFLDLPVDQPGCHLPPLHLPPNAGCPLTKMGCQGVEVVIRLIAREDRDTRRSQPPMQLVDHRMGRILRPRPWVEHRDNLGERIDHHPEPEHMHAAAHPSA